MMRVTVWPSWTASTARQNIWASRKRSSTCKGTGRYSSTRRLWGLDYPGPPAEELEVNLIPRRIRGKTPGVPAAVVVAQSQVDDVRAANPIHRACQVIASMVTTWGSTSKIRGAYGYPKKSSSLYGGELEDQWTAQLLVATMLQASADSRFATVDLQNQFDGGTQRRQTTN